MNTPTPNFQINEEIKFISEITIVNKEKGEYRIKLGTNKSEDILVFRIIPEDFKEVYYFQNKLTLLELQHSSKIFNYYETIREIIIAIPKLKFDINEKHNELIIIFKLTSPSGDEEITEINLKKYFINQNQAINDLLNEKQKLENIIKKKDKEIAELTNNVVNQKNKITYLESNNNSKQQTIITNENEIKKLNEIIKSHEDKNFELNGILQNYKQANENLNTIVSNFENQKNSQITAITNNYNQEMQRLSKELEEAKDYKKKYEELKQNYQKLNEDFEKLKIKDEKLEIENRSLKIDPFQGDISEIIPLMDDLQFIFTYIKQNDRSFQFNNLKLLFRASRDGDKTKKCHELCDNKKNVLIIIQSDIGNIFGGYSKIGFKTSNEPQHVIDNNCFLFSFDFKKIYPCVINKQHICHINDECGLCFTDSLCFFNNFMKEDDNLFYKKTIRDYFNRLDEPCEMNGGEDKFRCKELEVFQFNYN